MTYGEGIRTECMPHQETADTPSDHPCFPALLDIEETGTIPNTYFIFHKSPHLRPDIDQGTWYALVASIQIRSRVCG